MSLEFQLTENYLIWRDYSSPGYIQTLYRFEDNGTLSPDWENGFCLDNIENLASSCKIVQSNNNLYLLGTTVQGKYQLFGITPNQQILFEELPITFDNQSAPDLFVDENIYLAYHNTDLQNIVVEKYNLQGQNIWSKTALTNDFNNGNIPVLFKTSNNSLSVLISPNFRNLRLATLDLDGNLTTPLEGEIIANTRREKWLNNALQMGNGRIMFIWTDNCVSNCDYDPEYNAIAGQIFDFSNLPNEENTIPSSNYYKLSNYPNPFKPSGSARGLGTTISFNIAKSGIVDLDIYNI